jgi:hypothetical protein
MGHCVESGYGLVSGRMVALLDDGATPFVVDVLRQSSHDAGIRLRVTRRWTDGEMRTESAHVFE